MKLFAVIDTNVLVSAMLSMKSDAATVRLLKEIQKGVVCPLLHEEIIKEYRDVLARPKFGLPQKTVQSIVSTIEHVGQHADRVTSNEAFPDSKDVVFYEVALSKEDAYLVTGNIKHFPRKPIVVTPAEMMEIIDTANRKS